MIQTYVCNNLEQVKSATSNLSIATIVPLKIDDGGVIKDVNNFKGIYNVSQGEFCTVVSQPYNLIGHKQYFDGFAEAMSRLNMKFQMKITETGNKAFADIMFDNKRNIKFTKLGEEFATGLRLTNSYDKSTGLCVAPKYTRLACTNGMVLTRDEKNVSIHHNSKIVLEIESFIEKHLNQMISSNAQLQKWVSESMGDSIEWNTACKILQKLFSQPKHLEQILKRLDISVISVKANKNLKKKASVMFVADKEEVKTTKLTRWNIYNAITNYLTFGEQLTPQIENSMQKFAEKVLITPLSKLPMIEVPAV